jgi:hypothetical protein
MEIAKEQAAAFAKEASAKDRQRHVAHAAELLRGIAEQLMTKISEIAP